MSNRISFSYPVKNVYYTLALSLHAGMLFKYANYVMYLHLAETTQLSYTTQLVRGYP